MTPPDSTHNQDTPPMAGKPTAFRVMIGAGIILALWLGVWVSLSPPQSWRPEWKRQDAPPWALISKTEDRLYYISTRMVVSLPENQVAIVLKVQSSDFRSRASAKHFVNSIACGMPDHRFAIGSILDVDADDEPVGHAEEGLGVQQGSPIWNEVAAVAASQKEAACWLRAHAGNVPVVLPAYYATLSARAFGGKDLFAQRTEPVKIGQLKSPHGYACEVTWSESTREIHVSFSLIGSILSGNNIEIAANRLPASGVFAGYAPDATKALNKAKRLACSAP